MDKTAPAQYVSAVFESFSRRVMEWMVRAARPRLAEFSKGAGQPMSRLFWLDFVVDAKLRPHLVQVGDADRGLSGLSGAARPPGGVDDTDLEEVRVLQVIAASRERLERVIQASPAYFIRARRGDSFEKFRIVLSEVDERRFGTHLVEMEDACTAPFPTHESMLRAVPLGNYVVKRKYARHRDLKKRIMKRWAMCRHRGGSEERKLECIEATLRQLYRQVVHRERFISDEDNWVQDSFRELIKSKSLDDGGAEFSGF